MRDPHHVDVLIVGAGLSGIGAAHWLQMLAPDRSWTILEGRDDALRISGLILFGDDDDQR